MSVPDPESRLAALRFLERVQVQDLERTRRWIVEEEQRVAELARRVETLERVAPDWILQKIINTGKLMVHTGECFAVGEKRAKAISREEAVQALAQGAEPCNVCRPDSILGLDP